MRIVVGAHARARQDHAGLGAPTKKVTALCEIPRVERMIHAPAE